MPLLGGLFSRKKAAPTTPSSASIHSTTDSHADTSYGSSTGSHLHPDSARHAFPSPHRIPLSPTPSSSSVAQSTASNTSKLRLFGRKKSAGAPIPSSLSQTLSAPPPLSAPAARASTDDRRLRPPPSRSAIFAAYADPSAALSTRSLPSDAIILDDQPDNQKPSPPLPPNPGHRRPSLFAWTNSKSSTPSGSPSASSPSATNVNGSTQGSYTLDQQLIPDNSSFNLKSFRHVGSSPNPSSNGLANGSSSNVTTTNYPNNPTNNHSPHTNGTTTTHTPTSQFHSPATNYFSNNDSSASLVPPVPRPRPRGASTASEMSNSGQRISVAAFREAQARRSQAGSPTPSLRSTSPLPGVPQRTKTPDHLAASARGNGTGSGPRPSRSASHVRDQARRRRSSVLAYGSSDSEPDDSEAEEEDSDEGEETLRAAPGGGRRSFAFDRPAAGRGGVRVKAKSEAGHGVAPSRMKAGDYPMPTPNANPTSNSRPNPNAGAGAGVMRSGARSHAGHGTASGTSASSANNYGRASQYVLHDHPAKEDVEVQPRSQSSLGSYGDMRPRASVSTSAVLPSKAAKRASLLAGSSPISPTATSPSPFQTRVPLVSPSPRTPTSPATSQPSQPQPSRARAYSSSSSSSNSSDDAPLATLIAPKRPGSAMSSYSNLTSRSMGNLKPKPLIDINALTGGASPGNLPSRANTQEGGYFPGEKDKSKEGFTEGRTLLSKLGANGSESGRDGRDRQPTSPSARSMSPVQQQQKPAPHHKQQFQQFQQHQQQLLQQPHSPLSQSQSSQSPTPSQPTSPLVDSPTSMFPPVLSPLAPLAHLTSAPQTQPQPPPQQQPTQQPPLLSPSYTHSQIPPRSPWQAPVHSLRDGIPAPPLAGPGDTGPLGQTVAPSNWVTPASTPAKEVEAFNFAVAERERQDEQMDEHPTRTAAVDVPVGPATPTPEAAAGARRNALTDRLKSAVRQATSPPAGPSASLASVSSSSISTQHQQQNGNANSTTGRVQNQRSFSAGMPFPSSSRSDYNSPSVTANVKAKAPSHAPPPLSASPEDSREPSDEELKALFGNVSQFMSLTEDGGEVSAAPSGPQRIPVATPKGKQKKTKKRTGIQSSSSDSETSDSEGSSGSEYEEAREHVPGPTSKGKKDEDKPIAPIPIKQRSPPPAFSVTSRPPIARVRQTAGSTSTTSTSNARSSISGASLLGGSDNGMTNTTVEPPSASAVPGRTPRPRSVTLQHTSAGIGAPPASAPAAHTSRKSYGGEELFMPNLPSASASNSTSMSKPTSPSAATSFGPDLTRKSPGAPAAATASNNMSGNAGPGNNPNPRQRSATMVTGVPLSAQLNQNQNQAANVRAFAGSSAFANGGANRQSAAFSGGASSSGASAYSSANGNGTSSSGSGSAAAGVKQAPVKPFAESAAAARRNSPASSTGDSSSGRSPFTPRDGSDIVSVSSRSGFTAPIRPGGLAAAGAADGKKAHAKRRSVSFEEDLQGDLLPPSRNRFNKHSGNGSGSGSSVGGRTDEESVDSNDEERTKEQRRRERRRSEAKAAIELGNVVNGRGPILDDDDDDMPINQTLNARMSQMNPMMGMGATPMMPMGMNPMQMAQNQMQMGQMGFSGSPGGQQWNMGMPGMNNMNGLSPMSAIPGMNQSMLSPQQFMSMVPPPSDPAYLAAHQHAMLVAKQAYQYAVAQQAMAAAADEWERGSTMGGLGGGSVYGGGGSVYGGGGGSVYGGGSPSMMNMNMMGGGGGGWGATGSVYGGGARPMFGGSQLGVNEMMNSSRSEYGGGGGRPQNWSSSRSSYGESFGPDQHARRGPAGATRRAANTNSVARDSGYFPPVPALPASSNKKPGSPSRSTGARKVASPPSSWRPGG
ncbi:hypothetical protein D9619_002788 [Psilocybe cf. subviscida]|uniref:Uncharacterized protein n=1 Tax=Psilocybe cf. subviscida TaxID=2480587 RepID=A0A8H5AX61_9AGAR|nr:hypothetical protein D9619_002788 [Psilocybe cf. subviscida]